MVSMKLQSLWICVCLCDVFNIYINFLNIINPIWDHRIAGAYPI